MNTTTRFYLFILFVCIILFNVTVLIDLCKCNRSNFEFSNEKKLCKVQVTHVMHKVGILKVFEDTFKRSV